MKSYGKWCSTCYHEGCCDGLPYCGGSKWRPAYAECEHCGSVRHVDDLDDDGLCYECAEERAREEDKGGAE